MVRHTPTWSLVLIVLAVGCFPEDLVFQRFDQTGSHMVSPIPSRLVSTAVVAAVTVGSLPLHVTPADARKGGTVEQRAHHARKRHDRDSQRYDRQTANAREYDRARAENYDPGGSYAAYPDWARYALSPKGHR